MRKHWRFLCRVIVMTLTLAVTTGAQEPPKTEPQEELSPARSKKWPDRDNVWPKHWYTDWEWWAGETILLSEQFGDSYTTANRCNRCQETNFLLGNNPSDSKIVAFSMVAAGLFTTLHIVSWKFCPDPNRRSRGWRFACNATQPAISSAFRIHTILHNNNLNNMTASPASSALLRTQMTGGAPSGGVVQRGFPQEIPGVPVLRAFGGCASALRLCAPSGLAEAPKVDLSKVQLVMKSANLHDAPSGNP